MSSTFDEFQVILYQHPFDIITLSEAWPRNDKTYYSTYKYQDMISTTWNKTIVIAGDTDADYNKPSTVLETWKEVLETYNLKRDVKKPTRQSVKTIENSKLKKSS